MEESLNKKIEIKGGGAHKGLIMKNYGSVVKRDCINPSIQT